MCTALIGCSSCSRVKSSRNNLTGLLLQVGDEGAGHFVKMVHNGIEYGDMQLICEAYHLMKDVLGMDHDEMAKVSCVMQSSLVFFLCVSRQFCIIKCRKNNVWRCFHRTETLRLSTTGTRRSWTPSWSRSRRTSLNTGTLTVHICCPRSATALDRKAQGSGRPFQPWSTAHLSLWSVRGRKEGCRQGSICFPSLAFQCRLLSVNCVCHDDTAKSTVSHPLIFQHSFDKLKGTRSNDQTRWANVYLCRLADTQRGQWASSRERDRYVAATKKIEGFSSGLLIWQVT